MTSCDGGCGGTVKMKEQDRPITESRTYDEVDVAKEVVFGNSLRCS